MLGVELSLNKIIILAPYRATGSLSVSLVVPGEWKPHHPREGVCYFLQTPPGTRMSGSSMQKSTLFQDPDFCTKGNTANSLDPGDSLYFGQS